LRLAAPMVERSAGGMSYVDQVAIVTGGARGFGEGLAMRFAEQGAHVVVCDIDVEEVQKVSEAIKALGQRSLWFGVDVTNHDQIKAMVSKTIDEFGRIDILINNAGVTDRLVPTIEKDVATWERCVDIHLKGAYLGSREVARHMIARKYGRIINPASMTAFSGFPYRTAHGPAKAAIVNLTKTLAVEWAQFNITVNAVAPGYMLTRLNTNLIAAGKLDEEKLNRRIPMGHLGKVEDVVNAVDFLCSDRAGYITGHTLAVDGGFLAYGAL
jgi:NAD(P)-dependent dehydrogenase (short-subunit alcohol dehydrogenase family)